jgi:Cu(I)/Ag(I) efflux system membrane fusion protein
MNARSLKFIPLALLLSLFVLLSACSDSSQPGNGNDTTAQEAFREHAEKHADPTYVCPMHPDVTSDEPGTCPICGMDLVEKKSPGETAAAEREILYYRHPHNPEITSEEPAKDEMGMDFIPVYSRAGESIALDPAIIQTLGVRTAQVEHGTLWRKITTVGYIAYDDTRLRHVHPRVEGWIENLQLHQAGERIASGDQLFELYSPTLITAQEEFLGALRSGNARLIKASRDRLLSLDMAARDIERVEQEREIIRNVPYYAERDEVITELNVREGMFVSPDMEVMTLADLSRVWLRADIFDRQAEWVREGQPAEVRLSYLPGAVFEGEVEFVSPLLDAQTRTVEARLSFPNPDGSLKPNMFADIVIYGGPKRDVLFVPREALIRTPDGGRLVMALGDGRFSSRKVVPGMESGDYVEITNGVEAGERVVTSAQFLIDSETGLQSGLDRLDSTPGNESGSEPDSRRDDGHNSEEHQR